MLFCQECRDYALFDVEFYAEFLEEILRNTQNFGRNSAEKIGHWSLWFDRKVARVGAEAPTRAEFLQKRLISAFFGFQWQNLAEILHLFKKYNNIGKVAVKRVSWTDYAL